MRIFVLMMMLLSSVNVFSQTRDEVMKDLMEQRRQMMKRIMDSMDSLFNESFEEDFFNSGSPFSGIGSLGGGSQVDIQQKEEDDGSISIYIKPKDKNMSLDIKTLEDRITIKSETRQVTQADEEGNVFQSSSFSSYQRSIGIPQGYKASSPEAVDGGIKISLTPAQRIKQINIDQKKPLPKDGEII